MDPLTLKYARSHEWIHVEGNVATIGISDFAVKALTDLVYVDLPASGAQCGSGLDDRGERSNQGVQDGTPDCLLVVLLGVGVG